ncbi:hypothetical protein CLOM_g2614 [Closterium sp. NIES-68]|nr:hypothetical protein CLOM_g2614 [Closterium sp. NIES-68]GJP70723.1 hypothetical protein CLOP_g1633 [Closterium sp. NIES-67]
MAVRHFPSARASEELFDAFAFSGVVGEGQFGRVWRCVDRATGASLACKQIRKSHLTQNELDSLEREISAMKSLHGHRHVLPLRGLYEDEKSVYILTDLCDGGDLFSHVVETGGIPERAAAMIFAQIADAVRWCHVHRIVHRDIKPENVLITTTTLATGTTASSPSTSPPLPVQDTSDVRLEARLADFGLAMEIPRGFSLRGAVGSAPYEAPEVLAGDLYSFGADIWSLGVLLYATISAKWPSFPGNTRRLLPEVDFSIAPWPYVSHEAKDLIRRMLTLDTTQRLDIDGVLAHPWLRLGPRAFASPPINKPLQLASSSKHSSSSSNAPKPAGDAQSDQPKVPRSPNGVGTTTSSSTTTTTPTESPTTASSPTTGGAFPPSKALQKDRSREPESDSSTAGAASGAGGAGWPRQASFGDWSECGAEGRRADAGRADADLADLYHAEADRRSAAEAANCGAVSSRQLWSRRPPTTASDASSRGGSRSDSSSGSDGCSSSNSGSSSGGSSSRPRRLKREEGIGGSSKEKGAQDDIRFPAAQSPASARVGGPPKSPSHTNPSLWSPAGTPAGSPAGSSDAPSSAVSRLSPKAASPTLPFPRSASTQTMASLPLQSPRLPPLRGASPTAKPAPRSCPPQGIPLQPSTPKASPRDKPRTGGFSAFPKSLSVKGASEKGVSESLAGKSRPPRRLTKPSSGSLNERTPHSSSSSSSSGRSGVFSGSSSSRSRAWHRRTVSDVERSPAIPIAVPELPLSDLPVPDLHVSDCQPCPHPPRIVIPPSPAVSDSLCDDIDDNELTPTFCFRPAAAIPPPPGSPPARDISSPAASPDGGAAQHRRKLLLMPSVASSCSRYARNIFAPAAVAMASGPWQWQ